MDLQSPNTICKSLPNIPEQVSATIGGLGFKQNPLICGGYTNLDISDRCYSLENNQWISSDRAVEARTEAAAAQLQDGRIVVTGGYDGYQPEVLTEQGWEGNVPPLPVRVHAHCMVAVNSTTVMAIGGYQNDRTSGKTFYFNANGQSWTEGPELKLKRILPGCGKIRRDKTSQEMRVIVAGGFEYYDSATTSVEILDEGSNEWRKGPELPFGIAHSQLVEDQNGGVVLVGGYSDSENHLSTLRQLPHGGAEAEWSEMEQKLKIGKFWHSAFLVPDNVVDCS